MFETNNIHIRKEIDDYYKSSLENETNTFAPYSTLRIFYKNYMDIYLLFFHLYMKKGLLILFASESHMKLVEILRGKGFDLDRSIQKFICRICALRKSCKRRDLDFSIDVKTQPKDALVYRLEQLRRWWKSKVVWIGESYRRDMDEATERLVRIMEQLRVREASICCSNNGTKKRSTPLPPCGLGFPEKYGDFAYEFGSHNFTFLQRIYAISNGRCGCIGVDGDPNMCPHVLCSFRDFYLNCCSFSQQSEAHHGRSIDLVNGAPLTEEQARKIEFGNETLMWISSNIMNHFVFKMYLAILRPTVFKSGAPQLREYEELRNGPSRFEGRARTDEAVVKTRHPGDCRPRAELYHRLQPYHASEPPAHAVLPVLFYPAVRAAVEDGLTVFIELGMSMLVALGQSMAEDVRAFARARQDQQAWCVFAVCASSSLERSEIVRASESSPF
ncbi:hypothetical protein AURANDRAFT_68346 [Aureococcus anophagefferens]|uniref:Uncharacterized protein n=1 Tax=Aureococcus anophagefferens TaxID=44056 RepID=F0YPB3_AURAN|nr:hypothetical protein AURANDRAFT_68346 [Aureococcus anophagefferens]EGB03047.1 hypothetical protein AURANDRAFT_68346 [Aureococcus anophagefferens]|eukprot:XP_009042256.1 hypothetical protein AURANDRAFT_68346 [Aureococcus anophagefferens]